LQINFLEIQKINSIGIRKKEIRKIQKGLSLFIKKYPISQMEELKIREFNPSREINFNSISRYVLES